MRVIVGIIVVLIGVIPSSLYFYQHMGSAEGVPVESSGTAGISNEEPIKIAPMSPPPSYEPPLPSISTPSKERLSSMTFEHGGSGHATKPREKVYASAAPKVGIMPEAMKETPPVPAPPTPKPVSIRITKPKGLTEDMNPERWTGFLSNLANIIMGGYIMFKK